MIRKKLGRAGVAAVVLVLVLGTFAATASANRYTPGSAGLGDPFFPNAGNGGYDVRHYTLDLDFDPATDRLVGKATIVAESTQGLKTFNLDLRQFLAVKSIEVGTKQGFKMKPAEWSRDGQELVVSPREKIRDRTGFSVVVEYGGIVEPIVDPDDSIEGFVPTADGAYVVNEPQGSPGWYPSNDNPNDKALFDISVTVPQGLTALANGVLVSSTTAGGKTTWKWSHSNPMATYLATATLGSFDFDPVDAAGRDAELCRRRHDDHVQPRGALADPGGARVLQLGVRPLSVRCDRRHRRPRGERRLRARVADEAELPVHAERRHARARDRTSVVRRLGLAGGLAGHVAERGLRDLRGVALDRAPRDPDRAAGVRHAVRPRGHELVLAAGPGRDPGCLASCSTRPCTSVAP